ncbi:hypothetical protein MHU86_20556 [Fragilaria crotonensis]|nr:hypothetical protein MHU86_20556 [Fragilaria crotonensis]
MADQGIYTIFVNAVMLIRADPVYGPRLSNCWLPASTWVEALKKTGHIDPAIVIDVRKFNTAMSKAATFGSVMSRFDGSNQSGVFRINYNHQHFYYLTNETRQVSYPYPLNKAWKERVLETASNALIIPSTRARPAITLATRVDTTESTNLDDVCAEAINEQPSPQKRPRLEHREEDSVVPMSYWPDSPEARRLFRPTRITRALTPPPAVSTDNDGGEARQCSNETAHEAVKRRIGLLQSVHDCEDGWRNILIGRDENNFCTKVEIFEIRQRATFLCCAYQIALTNMNQITWHDCCKQACKVLNSLGLRQATFFKTVANWNKVFRQFEGFPHPNPYVQCGKRPLPRLLELFPDAKDQIVSFGIKNLATLTIERVHDFLVTSVIPRLARTWRSEENGVVTPPASTTDTTTGNAAGAELPDEDANTPIRSFLNAHRLESVGLTTTWRWMRCLGFNYDSRKKSFYVDGHERDDVVANRRIFCKRYLTEFEPYCKRWVQVSVDEAKAMNLNLTFGYLYHDIIGNQDRIEFHIDYWNQATRKNERTADHDNTDKITPTKSIRVSLQARPLMIVGQDESVFAQYLLGSKTWTGPKRATPVAPEVRWRRL